MLGIGVSPLEEEMRLLNVLPSRLRPFAVVALNCVPSEERMWTLPPEAFESDVKRPTTVMNSVTPEALLSVKRNQKVLSPYVFCSSTGKPLHNFERDWKPALRAVKRPDFHFHDLRHTFGSRLAMAGVDVYTLRRAGGSKTQVMVQRYAYLSPDHIRAAVERLANPQSRSATGTRTGTDPIAETSEEWRARRESNPRPSA